MNEHSILRAQFGSPISVVKTVWWLTEAEQRRGQQITLIESTPNSTTAIGPAREIMLLIGRMAANQHASLLEVEVQPNRTRGVAQLSVFL
jgi:hypothetical protein